MQHTLIQPKMELAKANTVVNPTMVSIAVNNRLIFNTSPQSSIPIKQCLLIEKAESWKIPFFELNIDESLHISLAEFKVTSAHDFKVFLVG